jgi:hypothetical protein
MGEVKIDGYKENSSLTKWVVWLLKAQIFVACVSLLSNYLEYSLLTEFQNELFASQDEFIQKADTSDDRQSFVGIAYLLVFVVSGILILKWLHRANYNSRQLGAKNMEFTPGWSIGYYFVPIMNLWKPYMAMKELWKASVNPKDWNNQITPGLLPQWWGLWIVTGLLGRIIFKLSKNAESLDAMIQLNLVNQLSDVLEIPLAIVLIKIVQSIHDMQVSHHKKMYNEFMLVS